MLEQPDTYTAKKVISKNKYKYKYLSINQKLKQYTNSFCRYEKILHFDRPRKNRKRKKTFTGPGKSNICVH